MDVKDRLYDNATQQFDVCIEKYGQKIKNCLWGMICHAYNEGLRDGRKEHDEQAFNIGAETMLDAIRHFTLPTKVLFTAFTSKEIASVFPDFGAVDFFLKDAKTILEKAEEIREARNNSMGPLQVEQDKFEIGDEVQFQDGETKFVVMYIGTDGSLNGIGANGIVFCKNPEKWHKTGVHYDEAINLINAFKQKGETSESSN